MATEGQVMLQRSQRTSIHVFCATTVLCATAYFARYLRRSNKYLTNVSTNNKKGLKNRNVSASHYAGRYMVGTNYKTVIAKNCIKYKLRCTGLGGREEECTFYILGGACSESFSGSNLATVLQKSHSLESEAIQALQQNFAAGSLNTHTSVGLSPYFHRFVATLGCEAPWEHVRKSATNIIKGSTESSVATFDEKCDDWFVSLQVEGASAVHAAFDVLLQLRAHEKVLPSEQLKVLEHGYAAVAETSYHGPSSTSFGSAFPLGVKQRQLEYPAPVFINRRADETMKEYLKRKRKEFSTWIEINHERVAVLFVEPQWGSSALAQPWPTEHLRWLIQKTHSYGIKV